MLLRISLGMTYSNNRLSKQQRLASQLHGENSLKASVRIPQNSGKIYLLDAFAKVIMNASRSIALITLAKVKVVALHVLIIMSAILAWLVYLIRLFHSLLHATLTKNKGSNA